MRKALGIMISSILLCGLVVAAQLATPPPAATVTVTINGNPDTGGVDTPWFDLSKGGHHTVSWRNATGSSCMIIYQGQSPFDSRNHPIDIGAGQTSPPKEATNAPPPPAGWPAGKVYKFYKYTVACPGVGTFDPGNGIKP